jgi:lipid-A-disaccharide synthase
MRKCDSPTPNSKLQTRNLLFSAGDLSGDIHSARLAREVLRRHPDWQIYALGGSHLREAGAHILRDTSGYGVIGFASALSLLPGIPRLRRQLVRFLQTHQPDAAVLCDWGAFNVRLAKLLQQYNVPVLYYFPPRSWQQSGDGGLGIVPFVERVATPFAWSAKRLQSAGCQAEWVGHPLLEIVAEARAKYSRPATRREFKAGDEDFLIAILPGSRAMELNLLSPHLAGAARLLQGKHARARFVIAVPRGAAAKVRAHFPADIPIVEERATAVLLACDAAIVKSGTATLEAAVCDAPQIVVYDLPPLLRAQWRLTGLGKKVAMVAMPNIILGAKKIPELLGDECRAPRIADALSTLIESAAARRALREEYSRVREALGEKLPYTATSKTADILDEMLHYSINH